MSTYISIHRNTEHTADEPSVSCEHTDCRDVSDADAIHFTIRRSGLDGVGTEVCFMNFSDADCDALIDGLCAYKATLKKGHK